MKKVRTFATVKQKSPVTMRHTREIFNMSINTKTKRKMNKKETIKFVVQLIAAIASAILTALGASSCMRL
jgi:hypothetical protein